MAENKQISGKNGAVGAGPGNSEQAGLRMLKAGGNAVDAGVASILALSVTDHNAFCFGGEVPMLIYIAETKKVVAVSGQGPAPKKANLQMFIGQKVIPQDGILSAAIPAVLGTCILALDKFGTMSFAQVVDPTLEILAVGDVEWYPRLEKTLERLVEVEKNEGGENREKGLEAVRRYFYEGKMAKELVLWNQSMGGLFTKGDMNSYKARVEKPVHGTYRGYDVYKCGFWTQGPALIQALNLLEEYDLASMKPDDPEHIHLLVESLKLAFADRDTYYADPDFADIPSRTLLSKKYAAMRRELIDPDKASLKHQPGDPFKNKPVNYKALKDFGIESNPEDTTTCVTADKMGNMFVATPSGWGSTVPPGELGIVLGTRLISLNLWEGHPNVLEPGKRPRITLSPTLVMKEEKPFMVVSVAGGDQQDQTALQMLVNVIDHEMQPQESADMVRFGTNHLIGSFSQTPIKPADLVMEDSTPDETLKALKEKGHNVNTTPVFPSQTVLIKWDEDGLMKTGGDLGKNRSVAVY
ncbi:hypothetical protein GF312_01820 [Candidatus Poribacteria bacterium]|nr:hypothetical protein [Candidatus Poribacteria bacterium]